MEYLPQQFKLGAATPDDYAHPYRWVNEQEGNVTPVLHCRFRRAGALVDTYAKLMDLDRPEGQIDCINEISGWLLAKACGLPVAPSAFMAGIRIRDLPPCHAVTSRSRKPDDTLYFFCTEAISQSQARGLVPSEALLEEQARWADCHATIALDEWLGNTDRHLYNLVRKTKDQFVLIDHGRLLSRTLTGPWWQKEELPSLVNTSLHNLLHRHVMDCRNITAADAVSEAHAKCHAAAVQHTQRMSSALHEIAYWCSAIAPGHSAAWLQFLRQRVQNAKVLLTTRFRLLNLV